MLYDFQEQISALLHSSETVLPIKLSKLPGKVTKGNNHKGFPFQVSDFPSSLSNTHTFSFRSVIWYAHHFSFSLILSGEMKAKFSIDFKGLSDKGYSILLSENIWETDLYHEPHLNLNPRNFHEAQMLFSKRDKFKIFKTFSLNHIDEFQRLGVQCFKDFFAQS